MNFKIYQNGKQIEGWKKISRFKSETLGVFESLRTYDGKIFHLGEHLKRLEESASSIGYKFIPKEKFLKRELQLALKTYGKKEVFIRLTLLEDEVFIFVGKRKHKKELYEKGVKLKTSCVKHSFIKAVPYQAKTSAYQQAILASIHPSPDKVYEWIFLNEEHLLTETRIGNFFLIKKGELFTPPKHLILNGVTRRFVIKCALSEGFKVKEIPLTRHDFFNADEAFLSNTSWEILPVRELDGRFIGRNIPGPITHKLHQTFRRRAREECHVE